MKKEVEEIMGGQILNYEAKDIRNSGIREGISIGKEVGKQEGEEQERTQNVLSMYRKGYTVEQIADALSRKLEEIQNIIEKSMSQKAE